ncbi:hypothetical protein [Candidatus Clavichlamydia salmonicola]|uniref:hypothetical protein n=1 Tax=Candidatus Clavichlamydia salmonicola TaxID=469812 RepID=UPI001890D75D|nr:hypothetical protein [Candidatus Clavichlamydia salmonicola]
MKKTRIASIAPVSLFFVLLWCTCAGSVKAAASIQQNSKTENLSSSFLKLEKY